MPKPEEETLEEYIQRNLKYVQRDEKRDQSNEKHISRMEKDAPCPATDDLNHEKKLELNEKDRKKNKSNVQSIQEKESFVSLLLSHIILVLFFAIIFTGVFLVLVGRARQGIF